MLASKLGRAILWTVCGFLTLVLLNGVALFAYVVLWYCGIIN